MRFSNLILLGFCVLLMGCDHVPFHSKSHSYLDESKAISSTGSVRGAQLKGARQYYPVPPIKNMTLAKQRPSIVPPGSDLQRFAKKKTSTISQLAKLENQNNKTFVAVNENINKAWKDVPVALSNTPYHVLDEDRSLSSFFVLDTPTTNNEITEKTPIYRLVLVPNGVETVVKLESRDNKPVSPEVKNRILTSLANSWHS